MQKRTNRIQLLGLLFLMTIASTAQNSVNSPYTRYGYGEIANHSFGAGRSMGGIGIGLRSSNQINPMNPASYSNMDSMTFLFDFGASFQFSKFKEGTNKQTDMNGNVDYIAMQFPIFKRVAFSAGLLPYSHVGYKFGEVKTSPDGQRYTESFQGAGGLNQLYGGLSIEIWKKRLSIGSNINYVFGTINQSARIDYLSDATTSVIRSKSTELKDVLFDFGLQFVQPVSKTDQFVVGLTYTPKKQFKNKRFTQEQNGSEIVSSDTTTNLAHETPLGYGFGISYTKANKFIAALDFSFQEWSKVAFDGKMNEFNNRSRIAAGFELIPNLYSRPYINRIRYRAGLNYTNSYIKVNSNGYKEFGATLGAGFPISDARSFVNFSVEYVKIVPDIKTMINEDYFRMTLSFTFNEYWFFKRRVD